MTKDSQQQSDFAALSDADAFYKVGTLIDASFDARSASGTDQAFLLLDELGNRHLSADHAALVHYFRANAWANREHMQTNPDSWSWEQPECQAQILELRRALRHEGFSQLPVVRKCQIFTNLANQLNKIGRFIEAVETFDRALDLDAKFGMARGNRGIALSHYARALYDAVGGFPEDMPQGGEDWLYWLRAEQRGLLNLRATPDALPYLVAEEAGADSITIHVEATPHVHYALQAVREGGCTAGAAICPATPVATLADAAADGVLDLALCMSVNPGWGNQTLIPHSFQKLRELRAMLPATIGVEVDGGVSVATARSVADAGANLLVAGTAVFAASDPGAVFQEIAAAAWPVN